MRYTDVVPTTKEIQRRGSGFVVSGAWCSIWANCEYVTVCTEHPNEIRANKYWR